ncbi:MAG: hypothetical protein K6G31_14220 [Paludibacteraceae bacterium]|nr:hypothetical protein [Paludibacteraceae bacterium]
MTTKTAIVDGAKATAIKTLMGDIDSAISPGGSNLYYKNREIIKSLFDPTTPYTEDVVYKRLIVIDALYSTNMDRRYYGIEDMACTIYGLSPTDDDGLRKLVREFRDDLFSRGVSAVSSDPIKAVFDKDYGIHKNLDSAGTAMSLLSKYFYFLLLTDPTEKTGFPIYDRLARDMYPNVCKYLYKGNSYRTFVKHVKTIDQLCDYFLALNELRIAIGICSVRGGLQEFDLLDAYLWRMGKFSENNFSLMLDKADYSSLITTAVSSVKGISSGAVKAALREYRKGKGKENVCPSVIADPLFAKLWDHAKALRI